MRYSTFTTRRDEMKIRTMALCTALLLAPPMLTQAATYKKKSDCVKVANSDWKACSEDKPKPKQALTLTLDNQCIDAMYVKVCLEMEDGEQDCKPLEMVEKGAMMEVETCDATGKYSIEACEEKRYCPE